MPTSRPRGAKSGTHTNREILIGSAEDYAQTATGQTSCSPRALRSRFDGGLRVAADHVTVRALEPAHGAGDELPPVVGKVQGFTHRRQIADRDRCTVLVEVDAPGEPATNRQVRRQPLEGTAIAHCD